jgi:hypothetical protein
MLIAAVRTRVGVEKYMVIKECRITVMIFQKRRV